MASLVDNCVFVATSSGTGPFVVSTALQGYQTPAQTGQVVDTTKTYRYRAESADKSQWEEGNTVSSSTQTSFTRVVTKSSAGGTTTVGFSNPPNVALTMTAADVLQFDDAMSLTAGQKVQALSNLGAAGLANANNFTDTTASTSPTTGAAKVAGGLGVAGDINWTGAAETSYTPIQSGTATGTATGRYKLYGKAMWLYVEFVCTSVGTVILSMPSGITGGASIGNQFMVGFTNATGNMIFGFTSTNGGTITFKTTTFTDPATVSARLALSGVVQIT